jgi:hypothetical protein
MAGGGALGGDEGIRRDERSCRRHTPTTEASNGSLARCSTSTALSAFLYYAHVAQREQSSLFSALAPLLSSRGAPRVVVGDEFCLLPINEGRTRFLPPLLTLPDLRFILHFYFFARHF